MRFRRNRTRYRGTIVPLFAILLIPLLGMLAFSIDVGWIALVRTDLQTAADAGALAGAEKLQALYAQYTTAGLPGSLVSPGTVLTTATTNTPGGPMDTAKKFASYNKAGNVSITVRDQDVTFGFTDAQGAYHPNYSNFGGFPNSITVIARRDSLANSPLALFFGRVFGFNSKELNATATATIYSGDVTSLQIVPGVNGKVLPVGFDYNYWQQFYKNGTSQDGTAHLAANGLPQIQVYPSPPTAPGSFGLLDIGPKSAKTPIFRDWIMNGTSPNDISYLLSNNLLPVSLSTPKQWLGGPGMTSTLLSNFQADIGAPSLLPLFVPVSAPAPMLSLSSGTTSLSPYQAATGTGSNATYAIVGFAGVTISQADGSGSDMIVSVQPNAVVDPTAFIQNPRPAGTQTSQFGSSTVITTFISAKLTQ